MDTKLSRPTPDPQADRVVTPAFVTICLATLAFWVSVFAHLPLLPLYMQEVGFREDLIGLVYGLGALTALVGRVGCGWAIDRWGARWFLIVGGLLWAVASPPMAMTTSAATLLSLWLLKGFALGIYTTASISYITKTAPPERRGSAVGWWGATNSAAAAIGPAAGAWVLEAYGFLPAFAAAGALGVLSAAAGFAPDFVTGKVVQRIQLYVRPALTPGGIGAIVGFATSAFAIFAPLRAQEIGMGNVGLYLSVYAVAMIAGRLVFGPLSDRVGRGAAILPSIGLMTAGMALIGFLEQMPAALVVPVLFGLGVGGAMPGLLAWTADRVPPLQRGVANSTFYSVYEIGLFLGAAVVGQVLEQTGFTGFVGVAVVLLVGAVWYVAVVQGVRRGAPATLGEPAEGGA